MTSSLLFARVLPLVVPFLGQQDKIDLACTCYDVYRAVIPSVYQNLLFSGRSLLEPSLKWSNVGSLQNPFVSEKRHTQVYELRQELLFETLTLNKELLQCVESVVVAGTQISPDLALLLSQAPNLKRFDVPNAQRLASNLASTSLASVLITDLEQLCHLPDTVTEIRLGVFDSDKISVSDRARALARVYAASSLVLVSDEPSICAFLKFLQPFATLRLRSLSVVYYHGYNDYNQAARLLVRQLLDHTDAAQLCRLEITAGCDQMACACLNEFAAHLCSKPLHLKQLALLQKTVHRDHNYTEKFDVAVTALLKQLPNNTHLEQLYLRHSPPLDGMIVHGFEGNYIKRRNLYQETLPLLTGLQKLVCPTFVWSLAGYEQLMSDLLWNGCSCPHCDSFLSLFDEFIMTHHFYDSSAGLEKDVISPCFFSCAAATLAARFIGTPFDNLPLLNVSWNFHTLLSIDHDPTYDCRFNQGFFRPLATCISHFCSDYVDALGRSNENLVHINLNGIVFQKNGKWGCTNERAYQQS
ncbi:hypothetical protein OGAPHI_001992 [Ogataea philodendri]|uniref:Uncharacterized protein n=1 Tax=Ogataea philodendri TaxID=1378263 RepID=A0A9P8T6L5_9ASCO|nr:uncharacterized protein OGAPHI_001992 [Ogataea philodendri]KAH3668238.1 hypothetical protein OGAPHI_001992 [Ogataea philodendri]